MDALLIDADGRCFYGAVIPDQHPEPIEEVETSNIRGWGPYDGQRTVYKIRGAAWEFIPKHPEKHGLKR